ncbi:hypothetical protein EOD41_20105 [Mucilaginibacter limnophilus]|uniref:Uncharacterized protein n=1 Tax=Mucilaginibacter limnophilus TaxID=1932778 RepID=A0A437MFW9_9SPHI|nr:hypothetical protein [Mucilaginibacter limnophilus]RVT96534.1 hypothetical protein EOD41_20105 [Mucilaginibacter limnophilus]
MNADDAAFIEEFKPLHVPHEYEPSLSWQDKVIFTLADMNNGTAEEVAAHLQTLEAGADAAEVKKQTDDILTHLYDKGLIKAVEDEGRLRYNLSKIQDPHTGKTDV